MIDDDAQKSALFTRRFHSDNPRSIQQRLTCFFCFQFVYMLFFAITIFGSWYLQEWRMSNQKTLRWMLGLFSINSESSCASEIPDFVDFCSAVFAPTRGSIRRVKDYICNYGGRWEHVTNASCQDLSALYSASVCAAVCCSVGFFSMIFSTIFACFYLKSTFHCVKHYRLTLAFLVTAWLCALTSCSVYGYVANTVVGRAFHIVPQSFASVGYLPEVTQPRHRMFLYGWDMCVATAVLLLFHILYFRLAMPMDDQRPVDDGTAKGMGIRWSQDSKQGKGKGASKKKQKQRQSQPSSWSLLPGDYDDQPEPSPYNEEAPVWYGTIMPEST